MRPIIKASLPAMCVDCGGVVMPGQAFDVGHIVALSAGGLNTQANVGASHRGCNRRAGGAMGGAKTRATNKRRTEFPPL